MSDKQEFENASLAFSKAQNELNDLISTRQQLETQYQENKIVLEEFTYLDEDSKIYKLTGPILLPQEYNEAKLNVDKRIEFIQEEIKRAETKIQSQEQIIETSRNKLIDIRQKLGN